MIKWDEDGRTIQEMRHDWYDDDLSDDLFDYWDWAYERHLWSAYLDGEVRTAEGDHLMGVSGIYIENHLYDFHLADVEKVVVDAAVDHMAGGCEYHPGWKDRVMAKILAAIPEIAGEALEAEESRCPERGIGVKEAA